MRQMLLGGQHGARLRRTNPKEKVRVYDNGVDFDVKDDGEARDRSILPDGDGAPKLDRREALARHAGVQTDRQHRAPLNHTAGRRSARGCRCCCARGQTDSCVNAQVIAENRVQRRDRGSWQAEMLKEFLGVLASSALNVVVSREA